MKFKIFIFFLFTICSGLTASGQTLVTPASRQSDPVILEGATIHQGNGEVIENGVIAFSEGKITFVGSGEFDRTGYTIINVAGKHIYPGFILMSTDLGLVEVESLRATIDNREQGTVNPNVRALVAYNTDSELIPTMRFNGILMAQIRPQGGMIAGSSSMVQLDAWNWEDAVMKEDEGIFMSWPNRKIRRYDPEEGRVKSEENKEYENQVQELKIILSDASAYASKPGVTNLKLEALKGLFDGSKTLYIQENSAKQILESVQFAMSQGVKEIVVVGGEEAHLILNFLKDEDIPVILTNIHRLPGQQDEDVDLPFRLPYILMNAGIKTALMYDGTQSARNLPFFAGTAATYGLDKEEALSLITLNAAEILGMEDVVGSLEVGKDATLFVSEGDALDMKTNLIDAAYIQGRSIQMEATQQVLFKKYKRKYQGE